MPSYSPPLLVLLVAACAIPMTLAFPGHFIDTAVGCMTDLDPSEVIMNNPVVPFTESSDKSMYIDIKDNGQAVLVGSTVELYFRNPNRHADVQYVIETSEGARFENGRCDHQKRVGGKSSSVSEVHKLVIDTLPVKVWGGWATGHEAVQLTDVLTLETDPSQVGAAINEAFKKGLVGEAKEAANDKTEGVEDTKQIPSDNAHETEEEVEAEIHERVDVAEELGDDEEADIGDLSHQLHEGLKDKVASDTIKEKLAKLSNVAEFANLGLKLPKEIDERIRKFREDLHTGNDRMEALKGKSLPTGSANYKDKKLAYLERMKERLHPDKYEQMKERMEQQFDRRDIHRNARHKIQPLHELSELEANVEEGLEQEAKKHMPQDARERMQKFHVHDKRWAERLTKLNGVPSNNEPVASEQESDSTGRTTRYSKLLDKYDQDHEIDLRQFTYAALFFVLSNIMVIQFCLWSGRREKGRREL
jgi:hypothetical protein